MIIMIANISLRVHVDSIRESGFSAGPTVVPRPQMIESRE